MSDLSDIYLVVGIFGILFLVVFIFYVLSLQNTLKAISPENRLMPPGQVWLLFIPLFSMVWQFIVVTKISDSIKAEGGYKGLLFNEDRPTYGIGIAMGVLNVCSAIPFVGSFIGLAGVVCWIVYWVKIVNYKKQLESASVPDVFGASLQESEFE